MANPSRKTTTKRAITSGPLVPWMYLYLQWLALEPGGELSRPGLNRGAGTGVTWDQKTARAGRIAHRTMSQDSIRVLEQRPDAIAYFEKIRTDLSFRAKELISPDIATNVEARREGLQHARGFVRVEVERDGQKVIEEVFSPLAVDPKAIEHYTRPVWDLAFPKKSQGDEVAPRITIYLGSKEAQALVGKVLNEPAEEVSDIEFEVIETKLLESGDEDG